jgi:nitrite reductase (NADH) small subunit
MKPVDMSGRRVLVTNIEGEYFAFSAECPHAGNDLAEGDLIGTSVICPGHNYEFDLRTGECLMPPGASHLGVVPVEERGEDVCIKLEW